MSCLQLGWAGLNQVLPVTNSGAHQASGGHYHERVGEKQANVNGLLAIRVQRDVQDWAIVKGQVLV